MKKLTVYTVYTEDRDNMYKMTVPAESKKAAIDYVSGNGDLVAIKESSLQDIDLNCLAQTLMDAHWGRQEIDVITRALQFCGLERF